MLLQSFGLVMILSLGNCGAAMEKRELAEKTELRLGATFPIAYESYLNDHFGFRRSLVVGHWIKINTCNGFIPVLAIIKIS